MPADGAPTPRSRLCPAGPHAHAHAHARTCTRARAHTHAHTHTRTHARTHAHTRTHTHTHVGRRWVIYGQLYAPKGGVYTFCVKSQAALLNPTHPPKTRRADRAGERRYTFRVKSRAQQTRAPRAARERGRCVHPALLVSCSLRLTPPQHTGTNARAKSNCAAIELREKDRAGECWPQVQMNIDI